MGGASILLTSPPELVLSVHESGMPWLSVVPPLLAIVLAIATRRPILSLFLGIWSGGVIAVGGASIAMATGWFEGLGVPGNIVSVAGGLVGVLLAALWGFVRTFNWIVGSIASVFHAQILVFTLLLGSGVALIWRLGGASAVRIWATERIKTQRNTALTAWALGIAMFFDDYANTAIVGSTMREISDRMRISREKLSYIVDSTAAPVATLAISSWVAFQLSMIAEGFAVIEENQGVTPPDIFDTFVSSIPFNTYSILAIVMVGLIAYTGRDYGEMLNAEHRSWKQGKVNRDGAKPLQDPEEDLGEAVEERPMLRTFFAPIAALIVVTIGGAFWTGYDAWVDAQAEAGEPTTFGEAAAESGTIQVIVDIIGSGDWAGALVWGAFTMVAVAMIIGLVYGLIDLGGSTDAILDGFALMLTAVTILVLAWSISAVAGDLGTGEYVASVAEGFLSPALLPVVVLFTSAFIAFTMGSSWATMGIVTPIGLPVAYNLTGDFALAPVVVGAVFSGAIFGDHSSPISDTTVLSSTFTGADLIDHVRTQLYYAVTVIGVVTVCYLLYGFLGVPPIVFIPLGIVLLVALVYGLSEWDANRKGIEPKADRSEQEVVDERIAGTSEAPGGPD